MPQNNLSYTENFLYMLDRLSEENYVPNPVLAKALDVLFILHADHELNCSTAAMRHISSSKVDPYRLFSFLLLFFSFFFFFNSFSFLFSFCFF